MLEVAVIVLPAIFFSFMLRRRFYSLFFVVLLTTEFYYINIGSGVARVYHFLAVIVVISLGRHVPRLFSSKVFLALMFFVGVNLCAVILSDAPLRALLSFFSLCANIAIAMATALVLLTEKLDLGNLKRIILTVTLISIFCGLIQIIAFRFFGVTLALSLEQVSQIAAGFGPAFRTEANTFGKYMIFPFLLFLPEYLENRRKHVGLIYLIFGVGILMNFTRSSIYGMGIALIFIAVWYIRNGKGVLLTRKSLKIIVAVTFGIFLMISGIANESQYAKHKIYNFFNKEELLSGGSSGYRLEMMRLMLTNTLSDTKKIFIGNGWGQTYFYVQSREVQAGGADTLNALAFSGIFGVFAYLFYMYVSFSELKKYCYFDIKGNANIFAEGSMFAVVGIFLVSQMSGYLIAPEYWMLIGIAIFISTKLDRLKKTQVVGDFS